MRCNAKQKVLSVRNKSEIEWKREGGMRIEQKAETENKVAKTLLFHIQLHVI